jgi:hypothetical protein
MKFWELLEWLSDYQLFKTQLYHSVGPVHFRVFLAVTVQTVVMLVVTPCSLAGGYNRFKGTYCLHLHGRSSVNSSTVKMEVVCSV